MKNELMNIFIFAHIEHDWINLFLLESLEVLMLERKTWSFLMEQLLNWECSFFSSCGNYHSLANLERFHSEMYRSELCS